MSILAGIGAAYGIYDSLTRDGAGSDNGFGSGLGLDFREFLSRRLHENPADSQAFHQGTEAIRDSVGGIAAAQRQRLGNAANTGGFLDSGAVTQGLSEINRNELEAFSSSQRDLILGLIDRQTQDIIPFLAGASGEDVSLASINSSYYSNRNNSLLNYASNNKGINFNLNELDYGDYSGVTPGQQAYWDSGNVGPHNG